MTDSGEEIIKVVLVFTIQGWVEKPIVSILLLYRRIRYGYAFRRIALTQGRCAIVDPEDFERLNKYKWHAVNGRHTFYAERVVRDGGGKRVIIKMHRQIIKVSEGKVIDHINHNGLDNRKANLRPATRAENNQNRRKVQRKFRSKYKGVSWYRQEKQWVVRIMAEVRSKFVGCFQDEIEAARAYDRVAKKYHGQFAVLNFEPKKQPQMT